MHAPTAHFTVYFCKFARIRMWYFALLIYYRYNLPNVSLIVNNEGAIIETLVWCSLLIKYERAFSANYKAYFYYSPTHAVGADRGLLCVA